MQILIARVRQRSSRRDKERLVRVYSTVRLCFGYFHLVLCSPRPLHRVPSSATSARLALRPPDRLQHAARSTLRLRLARSAVIS